MQVWKSEHLLVTPMSGPGGAGQAGQRLSPAIKAMLNTCLSFVPGSFYSWNKSCSRSFSSPCPKVVLDFIRSSRKFLGKKILFSYDNINQFWGPSGNHSQ